MKKYNPQSLTISANQDQAIATGIDTIEEEAWEPFERDRQREETVHTINKTP